MTTVSSVLLIWALRYTRLSYHEQTEPATGQNYVSITTNECNSMINYQIQQGFLYKSSHSKMCNRMDKKNIKRKIIQQYF
jgi:hypothetical protein